MGQGNQNGAAGHGRKVTSFLDKKRPAGWPQQRFQFVDLESFSFLFHCYLCVCVCVCVYLCVCTFSFSFRGSLLCCHSRYLFVLISFTADDVMLRGDKTYSLSLSLFLSLCELRGCRVEREHRSVHLHLICMSVFFCGRWLIVPSSSASSSSSSSSYAAAAAVATWSFCWKNIFVLPGYNVSFKRFHDFICFSGDEAVLRQGRSRAIVSRCPLGR